MSLNYGVPMLCAGITAGKNDVNAHVRFFKAVIDLKTDKPSATRIKKGVSKVFSNEYLNNAKKLQSILNTYNPNELIEKYIFNSDSAKG
jgi:UDP:flavonoid glycosyltransferase YjiC (YdhE family)